MNKDYYDALVQSGYTPDLAQKIAEGMNTFLDNITKKEGE